MWWWQGKYNRSWFNNFSRFILAPFIRPVLLAVVSQQSAWILSVIPYLSTACWTTMAYSSPKVVGIFGTPNNCPLPRKVTIIASLSIFRTPVRSGSSFPSQCNTNSWQSLRLNFCCISECLSFLNFFLSDWKEVWLITRFSVSCPKASAAAINM